MPIDAPLVRALVADQFPQWADLDVRPVPVQGHDNRTFRLGGDLAVRLPSGEGYVAGIAKEDAALPLLSRHLETPVPVPVATGAPGQGFAWPWSVRRWLDGVSPDDDGRLDRVALARDVGAFLRALRAVPAADGPRAGLHSFHRGCHPSVYGPEVEDALSTLDGAVDVSRCRAIWQDAVASRWAGQPVWFHGDLAVGNLLVRDGRLSAVIDFGTCGTGDPACDLVFAWTFLRGEEERGAFADAVATDTDTWRRARGWALWKALVTVSDPEPRPSLDLQRAALEEVLAGWS
ncbi:aminoglycoside phosphotransferase family protein [Oryzobacter terrae]|uniref:aminoglycoside phosphotransferase family protein n=1 Tax=Oryzobacter terrae TaxID=1620385 RepID=UPI003670CD91